MDFSPVRSVEDRPGIAQRLALVLGTRDNSERRTFSGPQVVIGRAPGNDLVVPDGRVSSCHAQIVRRDGKYWFEDLKSTNGSLVQRGEERFVIDGREARQVELRDGDRLLLGDAASPVELLVQIEDITPVAETFDPSRTIVASLAVADYRHLSAGPVRDAQKLGHIIALMAALDEASTEEELYRRLLDTARLLAPQCVTIACLGMGDFSHGAATTLCQVDRHHRHIDLTVLLKPLLTTLARQPTALLFDTAQMPGGLRSLGSVALIPLQVGARLAAALALTAEAETPLGKDDLDVLGLAAALAQGRMALARQVERLRGSERRLQAENRLLKQSMQEGRAEPELIAQSPAMEEVRRLVRQVAPTDLPVLILGETGSGKEVVARLVHAQSNRARGPFAAVNCGALTESLLESELFGHVKGAFTGATENKQGYFETASGGSLFLDEIGEMPPALQVRLLRTLESGEVQPVGSTRPVKVDVRIITATNRNPESEVAAQRFRQDLLYRINAFCITLPPLRRRGDDVLLLARWFADRFAAELGRPSPSFSNEFCRLLTGYSWPGNVRQLRNEVQRATLLAGDGEPLAPEQCSPALAGSLRTDEDEAMTDVFASGTSLHDIMERFEVQVVRRMLEECGWNKSEAARRLQISRQAFMVKLSKYHIEGP